MLGFGFYLNHSRICQPGTLVFPFRPFVVFIIDQDLWQDILHYLRRRFSASSKVLRKFKFLTSTPTENTQHNAKYSCGVAARQPRWQRAIFPSQSQVKASRSSSSTSHLEVSFYLGAPANQECLQLDKICHPCNGRSWPHQSLLMSQCMLLCARTHPFGRCWLQTKGIKGICLCTTFPEAEKSILFPSPVVPYTFSPGCSTLHDLYPVSTNHVSSKVNL